MERQAIFGINDQSVSGVSVKLNHEYGVYDVACPPGSDNMPAAGVSAQWFPRGGQDGMRFDVTHAWWEAGGDPDTVSSGYGRQFSK